MRRLSVTLQRKLSFTLLSKPYVNFKSHMENLICILIFYCDKIVYWCSWWRWSSVNKVANRKVSYSSANKSQSIIPITGTLFIGNRKFPQTYGTTDVKRHSCLRHNQRGNERCMYKLIMYRNTKHLKNFATVTLMRVFLSVYRLKPESKDEFSFA